MTAVFLNVGFLRGMLGLGMALTPLGSPFAVHVPAGEFGVPLEGVFEKKLRMEAFFDPALEVFFLMDGGGGRAGVACEESLFVTMMAVD